MGQTLKMRGGVEIMMGIASILFSTFYATLRSHVRTLNACSRLV